MGQGTGGSSDTIRARFTLRAVHRMGPASWQQATGNLAHEFQTGIGERGVGRELKLPRLSRQPIILKRSLARPVARGRSDICYT